MNKLGEIVNRVLTDEAFKEVFLADPLKATEGYNLNEEEIAQLKEVNMDEIAEINSELEDRISKSFINLPDFSGSEEDATHENVHTSHTNNHTSW